MGRGVAGHLPPETSVTARLEFSSTGPERKERKDGTVSRRLAQLLLSSVSQLRSRGNMPDDMNSRIHSMVEFSHRMSFRCDSLDLSGSALNDDGGTAMVSPAAVKVSGMQGRLDPTLLDPSQIKKSAVLGKGAFADVYRATLQGYDKPVAVKKLRSARDAESTLRFIEEGDILEKLQHPSIIATIGMGCESETRHSAQATPFIVQELGSHGSLKELLLKHCLRSGKRLYLMDDALRWMSDLASALAYLHERRPGMVIHRDLKPDNVLLCAEGSTMRAKLGDFGLMRVIEIEEPESPVLRDSPRAGGLLNWIDRPIPQALMRIKSTDNVSKAADVSASGSCSSEEPLRGRLRPRSSKSRPTSATSRPGTATSRPGTATSRPGTATSRPGTATSRPGSAVKRGLRKHESLWELPPVRQGPAPIEEESAQTFMLTNNTGSSLYMAPEVAGNGPYNEKCDVYSFGLIAYETLNYYPLIVEASPMGHQCEVDAYVQKLRGGYRPSISKFPAPLRALLSACWHANPEERPTMDSVSRCLQALRAHPDVLEHDALLGAGPGGSGNGKCKVM